MGKKLSNHWVEANRRHADPVSMGLEFERVSCARPLMSAAVAHPYR
jgi:hypothetical protein